MRLHCGWGVCGVAPFVGLAPTDREGSVQGKDIVMGTAVGLTLGQVMPFVRSLQGSAYEGDVVLFVDRRLYHELRGDERAQRIRLVPIYRLLPLSHGEILSSRGWRLVWGLLQSAAWSTLKTAGRAPLTQRMRFRVQTAIALLACTPMEARFLRYRRFLETESYERVLVCDVRDVVFQNNPFEQLPLSGLAVSIETRRYTLATEPHNREWLRQVYGPAVVEEIGSQPVSCVGVTYGDIASMRAYLALMTAEILRLSATAARHGGADTATHNFLLWTNRLDPVRLLETLASPVATLNDVAEGDVKLSPEGKLLNRDGSEPSILHQYDRVPGLAPALLRSLAA